MSFPPMSGAVVPPDATLETRQELFETQWRHRFPEAPPPRWDEFLPLPGQFCTPDFVFLLLQTDIEFRIKAGQAALLAEPYFQHPRLHEADARLEADRQVELIRWEYQQRWKRGDRAARQDYIEHFPEHAVFLHDLRPRWNCAGCQRKGIPLEDETMAQAVCPRCRASFAVTDLFPPLPLSLAAVIPEPEDLDPRHYDLLDRLGSGGMGEVYRSRDPSLRRDLAIKVLRTDFRGNRLMERRFEFEARVAGALQHPGIVPIHNLGRLSDGRLYFTMKVVRGQTLGEVLREPDANTSERRAAHLSIFEKVCQAVAYAHSHGVIHRDLKPANVMVGAFGEVQVMDWGLAKVLPGGKAGTPLPETAETSNSPVGSLKPGLSSQAGMVMGTPAYMAPEQARGEVDRLDARCDVFGLGALLCVLLTGQPPYRGSSLDEQFGQALSGDLADAFARLEASGADAELRTLAKRCLAAEAVARPADAGVVAVEIKAYQEGVELRARKEREQRVAAEARAEAERRARWLRILLGALLVAVAVGAVAAAFFFDAARRDAQNHAQKAQEAEQTAQELAVRESEARQGEQTQRRLAEVQLTEMQIAQAMRFLDENDLFSAFPWLVAALQRTTEDPEREAMQRVRLKAVLRQCPRLVRVFFHDQLISSAEFSPDGRRVLTASHDGTARVWDLATGQALTPPLSHAKGVQQATFSPDGGRVVTAGRDGTARVWDAATGKPLSPPLVHKGQVQTAVFSPDGRRVLTASWDRTAQVWDAATGQPLLPPLRHDRAVLQACFSPDGRQALTASYDRTARLWDAGTGQPSLPPWKHKGVVQQAQFSPNGRQILTNSWDQSVYIWDAVTGQAVTPPLRHQTQIQDAVFSRDGRRLLTVGDFGKLRLWEAATGQSLPLSWKGNEYIRKATFSPDGRRLLTAGLNGQVQVLDARTGQPITPPLAHPGEVEQAVFHPDGRRILTVNGATARLWDLAPTVPAKSCLAHAYPILHSAFSPDGRLLATCGGGEDVGDVREARLWEMATGQPVGLPLPHPKVVRYVAFSPDSRFLFTVCFDRVVRVWDVASRQPAPAPERYNVEILRVAISPDGRYAATVCGDKTVHLWDPHTGQALGAPLRHERPVKSATFSPDSRQLVTVASQQLMTGVVADVCIWDVASGQLRKSLGPLPTVFEAVFLSDGRLLATLMDGSVARVLDVVSGRPLGPAVRHHGGVVTASCGLDGRRLLTASADNTARLWDVATGRPLGPPLKHGHGVNIASFSPDGRSIVTASWDQTARLWDARTGQPLSLPLPHDDKVRLAWFSPDGRRVVTIPEGVVRSLWIWDVAPREDRPIAEIVRLMRFLSSQEVDPVSGSLPVRWDGPTLREAWQTLRTQHPGDFTCSPEQILAWHRREAELCERDKHWSAAAEQLGLLLAAEPTETKHRLRRAHALAESERWPAAAADFAEVLTLREGQELSHSYHAVALLAAGDIPGYRKACAHLLQRFGLTLFTEPANVVAWTGVLTPEAGVNPTRLVQLSTLAVLGQPENPEYLTTLGAALYRNGQPDLALRQLEKAVKVHGKGGLATTWLFLALTHQRLGQPTEARSWRDKAVQWIDQGQSAPPTDHPYERRSWSTRFELRQLRSEVEMRLQEKRAAPKE